MWLLIVQLFGEIGQIFIPSSGHTVRLHLLMLRSVLNDNNAAAAAAAAVSCRVK